MVEASSTVHRARGGMWPWVFGAIALAVVLLVWAEAESWIRQREIERLTANEGGALAETLGHAVEHALASSLEIGNLASARLLDEARLFDRLEETGRLDATGLDRLTGQLALDRVVFYDTLLRRVYEGRPGDGAYPAGPDPYAGSVASLVNGDADELVLGARHDPESGRSRYAAAVRRRTGGAVLVVMDADEMLAFQREIGVAPLLDGVVRTGGIVAATLTDDAGRTVASAGSPDAAGEGALTISRPVDRGEGPPWTLSIALSRDEVAAAARAGRRRVAAASIVAIVLVGAAGAVVLLRRRAAALHGESVRARSLTDAVLDGIADAVVVSGRDGVLRLVNPAASALFGRSAEEMVGRPCAESPCAPAAALLSPEAGPREIAIVREDGSSRTALGAASPLYDESGRRFGTALVLRDLTDIKGLERATRRTESLAAFGRLAAAVAHEVRNPLNAIAVGVQRLEREIAPGDGDAEHRRLAGLLRGEIARLDAIVGRFLDLARPPRIAPRPGDLAAAAREAAGLIRNSLPADVRLVEDLDAPVPAVFDPEAVRQVLHNLIRNAVEASTGSATVRVAARVEPDGAVLDVVDDGPGIAPADRERVFEFGYTTKPRGNGLGLPVVHRLVSEMGGSVDLPAPEGPGTIVRVRLPAAAAVGVA